MAALVLGGIMVVGAITGEPCYRGRTLTSWLERRWEAASDQKQLQAETERAIQSMGADKVTPHLLKLIQAQDGPVREWLLWRVPVWRFPFLKFKSARVKQMMGVEGFAVLGTNGAGAVPALTRLLADTNCAMTALECLVNIGYPARAPVCGALTNSRPEIRAFAAYQLAAVIDDMDVYLARLKGPLRDVDPSVRQAAVRALEWQKQSPQEVVPLLIQALKDPPVAGDAANALGGFGTNGLAAFGALSNLAEHGDAVVATAALKSLLSIASDRALPLVHERLRSAGAGQRASAARMLRELDALAPASLAALRNAAKDSDLAVARDATEALEEHRKKERARGGGEVIIGDEPSYGGKRLGQWLKERSAEGEFSAEARKAIQSLGAKAVPALLERMTYRDPKYGLPDQEQTLAAVGGFITLGEKGSPALPKLEQWLNGDDSSLALYALLAACNMGTNSRPVLLGALTNRYAEVRNQTLVLLEQDPMKTLQQTRADAVPEIISLLGDPDESVRWSASNALREIAPAAAANAGASMPADRPLHGGSPKRKAL